MPPVVLVRRPGERKVVDDGSALFSQLMVDGWSPEAGEDTAAGSYDAGRVAAQDTVGGAIETGVSNFAGGLSFGGTRILEALTKDDLGREEMRNRDRAHPRIATGAYAGGAIAQGFLLPGGGAASGLGGVAKTVGVGAGIGAGESIDQYISNALVDGREITMEGALAAGGTGAAFGGLGAGVFAGGESTLGAIKRLFPGEAKVVAKGADRLVAPAARKVATDDGIAIRDLMGDGLSREAVDGAAQKASTELRALTDDTATLEQYATARLDAGVRPHLADPAKAAHLEAVGATAEQRALVEELLPAPSTLPAAPKPKRGRARKPPADSAAAPPADDLTAQLQASVAAGPDEVAAARARRNAGLAAKKRAAAELDPELAQLQAATDELAAARADLNATLTPAERRAQARATAADWARPANEADAALNIERRTGLQRSHPDDLAPTPYSTTAQRGTRETRNLQPLTDEELIAQSVAEPRFLDHRAGSEGRFGGPAGVDAAVLPEYMLKREVRLADLEVETLGNRVNPETGEVLPGVDSYRRPATLDEVLATAGSAGDFDSDIIRGAMLNRMSSAGTGGALEREADIVAKLGRLEAAEANMVNVLGPGAVPPGSARRAAEYGAAADHVAETRTMAAMQHGEAVTEAGALPMARAIAEAPHAPELDAAGLPFRRDRQPAPGRPPVTVPGAAGKGASNVLDAAAALELLGAVGVPGLPSATDIPLVGPVLSLYLKARAGLRAFGKLGGKVPRTVETEVMSRAAATRDKLRKLVERSLGPAQAGMRAARRVAPPALAVLAVPLFRDDEGPAPEAGEDAASIWQARSREVAASQEPGAIARAVRLHLPTRDPRMHAAAVATLTARMAYLADVMPKAPAGFGLGVKLPPWRPGDAEMEEFARVTRAVTDPLAVIEDGLNGDITVAQVDAIREVYPKLYAEAQQHLVELALERDDIPHARRAWLSTLWGVPMDPQQTASYAASMQATYAPPPAPTGPPGAAPPAPGLASPVDLSRATMLPEQSR